MNKKKINKNYITNSILKCSLKNGKNIIFKNLMLNSIINISQNNKNCDFYELFENIVKNYTLPFKIPKKKNKYICLIYNISHKSVSSLIRNILNNIKKNKKKVSFDFYFKNEINKLVDNTGSIDTIKKNTVQIFNNINYKIKSKVKNTLNENPRIKNILIKKNTLKYNRKYYNFYYKCNYYIDIIKKIKQYKIYKNFYNIYKLKNNNLKTI